jgi:hypothetical protein
MARGGSASDSTSTPTGRDATATTDMPAACATLK